MPEVEAELARLCADEGVDYAFAGYSAGARYAPAVRYQRAMAYIADEEAIPRIAAALQLKDVPSGANVTLISPYDRTLLLGSRLVDDTRVGSPAEGLMDLRSLRARVVECAE